MWLDGTWARPNAQEVESNQVPPNRDDTAKPSILTSTSTEQIPQRAIG